MKSLQKKSDIFFQTRNFFVQSSLFSLQQQVPMARLHVQAPSRSVFTLDMMQLR